MTTIKEWPAKWRATIQSQFFLAPSNLSSSSPYTGQTTPYGPQVQVWTAKLTFPTMRAGDNRMPWRQVQGFITGLRGITGRIRMIDYNRMKPFYDAYIAKPTVERWSDNTLFSDGSGWSSGNLPPFITVDEAAEEGADSIVVSGLPASLTAALDMGDLFEVRPDGIPAVHGHLYEVTGRANTNSDGKTRIYFQAGLRKAVKAGDMIVLRYPTSVFQLASDQEGVIQRGLANLGDMGLSLTEVLPWQ
jgi:hypothetical protein